MDKRFSLRFRTFTKVLNLNNKISQKNSSYNPDGIYYHVQFGNVAFYQFLLEIGLTPHKSRTIGELNIPNEFFADFLRGHLDGDGYTSSYWSKKWKNSFVFYTYFISAGKRHIEWLKENINKIYGISGNLKFQKNSRVFRLAFAKKDSLKILEKIYYKEHIPCLLRKKQKIFAALDIIQKKADVVKWQTRMAKDHVSE